MLRFFGRLFCCFVEIQVHFTHVGILRREEAIDSLRAVGGIQLGWWQMAAKPQLFCQLANSFLLQIIVITAAFSNPLTAAFYSAQINVLNYAFKAFEHQRRRVNFNLLRSSLSLFFKNKLAIFSIYIGIKRAPIQLFFVLLKN